MCPSPPLVSHAVIELPIIKNFTYGSNVTYTCLPDDITGRVRRFDDGSIEREIFCSDDGQWSNSTMKCDSKYLIYYHSTLQCDSKYDTAYLIVIVSISNIL